MSIDGSLDKIVAIILAVILVFIAPALHQYKTLDTITYNEVYTETSAFVDKCTSQGQITKSLYEDFANSLAIYGNYHIKIEHQKRQFIPDPADPAGYQEVFISSWHTEIFDDYIYNLALPKIDRVYNMNAEDYLMISVTRKSKTYYEAFRSMLTGRDVKTSGFIRIGGMIRNEHN